MSTSLVARALVAGFPFLWAVFAVEVSADPLKVCTFSFNAPEEVAVFESRLPPTDFEFLDVPPRAPLGETRADGATGTPPAVTEDGRGWLQGVCQSGVECDVVVLSAEFAGKFFGRYGGSLSLQEMEEASCRASCDGLFRAPREVFLLGCNTLATKDEDHRGPEVYLQVLLDHDFDRASAERVVAMRYGPLGPTFREALRRVFMGVPRIYGFSSVAPSGPHSGPMLERYFSLVGDYRSHLEKLRPESPPNRALATAFAGTSFVETSGLAPSDPAAADRDLICGLYDERKPIAERLEIVKQMMTRSDLLVFVPSVQQFVNRHPSDDMRSEERVLFEEVQRNQAARERVLALIDQLDVSALQLELGHFAVHMGWMTRERFRVLVVDSARQLLRRPLTSEVVDVMCEVPKHEFVGDQFAAEDLPEALFRNAEGVRLVSCLAPPDDGVSARLAAALGGEKPELRVWAAHALSLRLPLPDPVLLMLIPHLQDPSPDVTDRVRWILETQQIRAQQPLSTEVKRALKAQAPDLVVEPPAPEPTPQSSCRWWWCD
jgi:hypothetical protein